MSRDARYQYKDMQVLREGDAAQVQAKSNRGDIKDYSLRHKVSVEWDISDDAIKDRMFVLKVDDYQVVLDSEEFRRLIRWV